MGMLNDASASADIPMISAEPRLRGTARRICTRCGQASHLPQDGRAIQRRILC